MNRASTFISRLGSGALELLFPPLCVACDDRLPDAGGLPLCAPCRRSLPSAPPDSLDARLSRLPGALDAFEHRLALWTFDEGGVLQKLQHVLKYGDRPSLGIELGRPIGRLWVQRGLPLPDFIVPIPLGRTRSLERGYNQAERIARGIADEIGAPVAELVTRTRATRSQTKLSRKKRRANVDGAFGLAEGMAVAGGDRVLLVDDVLTTGATLLAAAMPLARAGAVTSHAVLALTRE